MGKMPSTRRSLWGGGHGVVGGEGLGAVMCKREPLVLVTHDVIEEVRRDRR